MATRLSPAGSSAVIEVADGLVERYTAQGWVLARGSAPEKKYPSQMNKGELIEFGNTELGLGLDDSLSKKDLLELINSAQAEK